MGKQYSKRKLNKAAIAWIGAAAALIVLTVILTAAGSRDGADRQDATVPSGAGSVQVQPITQDIMELEDGLRIKGIASYAGIYMEDGSDEAVSNIMMLILENTGSRDLQLARIDLVYADFTAQFEATNLPAGESVVLLEKNRHPAVKEDCLSAETKNVIFFEESMDLMEDRLTLEGAKGAVRVTNRSDRDISGDIFIYYKNSAEDLFYGGITYRARLEGGLPAGETAAVLTGHYTPENCRIVMVTCDE